MTFKNVEQAITENVEKAVQETDPKNINIFEYSIGDRPVFGHLFIPITQQNLQSLNTFLRF